MTNILNEQISNFFHTTGNESFSTNAANTTTSGISLSNDNQSNPTTPTFTSISAVPAQPDHSQIVKYNPNSFFQNLLKEAQQIYKNQKTDSTQLQYLSTNTTFVVFIFKNYRSYIGTKMNQQLNLPKILNHHYK